MPSYKIHSIKDSEKLSFIVEWESESSISQKLSGEGHIILSVEKIEAPTEHLFCFEGKKWDGSFIQGKISADDIFLAYEMLLGEYKYTITKLYPEAIEDTKKQEKIFRELLATFQENTIKKPKKTTDTSKQLLIRYKKILQKLVIILQKELPPQSETLLPDLKKLDQNNNVTLIQQSLKENLKKLFRNRENKTLFNQIKPLMKEMGMFVPPDIYFSFLEKIGKIFQSLTPLLHPRVIQVQHHTEKNLSLEAAKKEYESIETNKHIHTFLRKKYRPKVSHFMKKEWKKYYIYTLLREKTPLFISKKIIKNLQKIATIALFVTAFVTCLVVFLGLYSTLFVTTGAMSIFLGLIIASLVIQSETV